MTAKKRDRHHFVFLHACGCPFGLVEQGSWAKDVDGAWESMYETRAEERAARNRGVQVVHVNHATYSAEFYPRMLSSYSCPHGGAR